MGDTISCNDGSVIAKLFSDGAKLYWVIFPTMKACIDNVFGRICDG